MTKEKKVKSAVRRPQFADEKYLGPEPTVTEDSTDLEMGLAYNWFNYFYTSEDAKSFTISYLKYIKYDKSDRKSTRLNSSHSQQSRMPSSA